MLRTSLALALGTFALGALAAEPYASLRTAEGTVMVNQGERYVTATEGMVLSPGDRIMVMAGSKAVVRFGDGCSLPLGANVVTSIPAQSTCAGGVADVRQYGPSYAQALGDTPPPPPRADDDDQDHHRGWWIAAGVTAAAILIYCEGDHRHHCHHHKSH